MDQKVRRVHKETPDPRDRLDRREQLVRQDLRGRKELPETLETQVSMALLGGQGMEHPQQHHLVRTRTST